MAASIKLNLVSFMQIKQPINSAGKTQLEELTNNIIAGIEYSGRKKERITELTVVLTVSRNGSAVNE